MNPGSSSKGSLARAVHWSSNIGRPESGIESERPRGQLSAIERIGRVRARKRGGLYRLHWGLGSSGGRVSRLRKRGDEPIREEEGTIQRTHSREREGDKGDKRLT